MSASLSTHKGTSRRQNSGVNLTLPHLHWRLHEGRHRTEAAHYSCDAANGALDASLLHFYIRIITVTGMLIRNITLDYYKKI